MLPFEQGAVTWVVLPPERPAEKSNDPLVILRRGAPYGEIEAVGTVGHRVVDPSTTSTLRPTFRRTWHDGIVGRRSEIKRAAAASLKRVAASTDRLRKRERGIVVLGYHRVGRHTPVSVDLPEWLFEEQMVRLRSGPGIVDIDTALEELGTASPSREVDPVVITFDDGTADFVDVTVPILVEQRVPALLYVATDFVESGRSFPDDGRPASWAGLRDAVSTGLVTIGSHTHRHVLLDRTDPDLVAAELDRSIELIGDRIGALPRHFAYPKALPGSRLVDEAVMARFSSAAVAGTRSNRYGNTDLYRLARSPIQVSDGLHFFELKVQGGMRLEDDLRRLSARWRFAGAVS
jgi:peptidoglycan/xylan/chitin deacetylase (PgdA/CDA1 family)